VPVEKRRPDGSWGRLAWTLPVALVLTILTLTGFVAVLSGGVSPPSVSDAVSVKIVELSPEPSQAATSPASQTAPPPPDQPPPSAAPVPPPPEPAPPIEASPTEPAPPIETPPLPPPRPERKPEPAHTQPPPRRERSRQPLQDRTASPMAGAPAGAEVQPQAPGARGPAGGMTMGARTLYQPMPDIPEELRHRELAVVAMARFHVATDGSATVTLLQATADPRLNAALMSALRRWRFFPAMENGQPVASTIDIRVPIEVH
jgi:protein TonB